ncbi:MAG: 30S ribosomal protein S3ae [Promethearchaeota archaeon]
MSQQKTKRKKKAKVKKVSYKDKNWYEVIAPQSFNFKNIGEIIGLEPSIQKRTIEALLFDFTGDFNDINLKLRFRVSKINHEAKKCETMFIGHQYTNDYIRSLVGRGSSKITTIQNLTTRDGFVFRVTTICVTIKRARSSQQVVIRKIMTDILKEFAKSLNHEKFIHGMIYGEFQNQIARVAKTLYPLSSSTIVKSKVISFPEGVEDKEVESKQFDIVEIDVKRIRKSDIKRTERINVKKFAHAKTSSNREIQTSEAEDLTSDDSGEENEED